MPMSYPDGWQRTAARARIRTFMLTSLPAFTQSVGDHPVLFLGCIDHKWGSSYLGKLSREHTSQGDFHDPSWDIPPRTVSARRPSTKPFPSALAAVSFTHQRRAIHSSRLESAKSKGLGIRW
jgi:hypothetical protein